MESNIIDAIYFVLGNIYFQIQTSVIFGLICFKGFKRKLLNSKLLV